MNLPDCRFLVYSRFLKSVQGADLARTLYEQPMNVGSLAQGMDPDRGNGVEPILFEGYRVHVG
jgi:hypothetical protein